MGTLLFLVGIVGIALIVITIIKKANTKGHDESPAIEDDNLIFLQHVRFKKKNIMTETELNFFHVLAQALPGYYIFPQVATHAILQCNANNPSHYWKAFNRFNSTIIDYVICDANFTVTAIIELDDRTHEAKKDKDNIRDAMLTKAGYNIIRLNCKAIDKCTPDFIRNQIIK
jgi:hypothetical protein